MKKWWSERDWVERLGIVLVVVFVWLLLLLGCGLAFGLLSNFIHWVGCEFQCAFYPAEAW